MLSKSVNKSFSLQNNQNKKINKKDRSLKKYLTENNIITSCLKQFKRHIFVVSLARA